MDSKRVMRRAVTPESNRWKLPPSSVVGLPHWVRTIEMRIRLLRRNVWCGVFLDSPWIMLTIQLYLAQAIYGQGNSPAFLSETFSAVLYHNRSPAMYDEFKIQLPTNLDENHYLLFTFYHVTCRPRKLHSDGDLHCVLGYSWLPVLHNGSLCDMDVNLLVSSLKPTPLLARLRPELKTMTEQFHMSSFKWLDSTRELFSVSVVTVSSMYPRDTCVEYLLDACGPGKLLVTLKTLASPGCATPLVEHLRTASLQQLVAFFTPLMDGFLRLLFAGCSLCAPHNLITSDANDAPAFAALSLLCHFVDHICGSFPDWNDSHGRNQLIVSYLYGPQAKPEMVFWALFCGSPISGIPVMRELLKDTSFFTDPTHACIPGRITRLFLGKPTRLGLIPLRSWWFIFELLVRLLAEFLTDVSQKKGIEPLGAALYTFLDPILIEWSVVFRMLTKHLVSNVPFSINYGTITLVNRAMAFLLCDLAPLTSAQFLATELFYYCEAVTQQLSHAVYSLDDHQTQAADDPLTQSVRYKLKNPFFRIGQRAAKLGPSEQSAASLVSEWHSLDAIVSHRNISKYSIFTCGPTDLYPTDFHTRFHLGSTDVKTAVTEILERVLLSLLRLDAGRSLLTVVDSEVGHLLPFQTPEENSKGISVLGTLLRVLFYALTSKQHTMAYSNLLRCIELILDEVSIFPYVDVQLHLYFYDIHHSDWHFPSLRSVILQYETSAHHIL
ncbi:unnamed protein product [Dicrocoelium dendriticum]|nr:unnamed protein product [Dicrocoelium dendriticum]